MQIILPHKNVDFDALASLVAASLIYPDAKRILPTSVNQNVRGFLSIHKDIFSFDNIRDYDLKEIRQLIVVDSNRWCRFENIRPFIDRNDLDIYIWDHHPGESDIRTKSAHIEGIGATVTLLVEELKEQNIEFSPICATLFLAGIYEDTGHLTFPSTTPRDLRAAAYLLEKHADLKVIQAILRPTYGPKQQEILFKLLAEAESIQINGFDIRIGRIELDGHVDGLAEVMSMYVNIINVDAAFGIFWEIPKKQCIIIGRSGDDSFDVGAVMRLMGGGGHAGAGSATIKDVQPGGIRVWLKEAIADYRQFPVQLSDLMSFPVESIDPNAMASEVDDLLNEKGFSGMPVVDDGKLIGVISKRDIHKIIKEKQKSTPVKAIMSRKIITITPMHSVAEAMKILIRNDIGRLPVVENDKVIGIISRSDAMIYYYDLIPD